MVKPFTAACVQMNSGPDMVENLNAVTGFVRQAHLDHGAELICTPENSDAMMHDRAISSACGGPSMIVCV